MATETINNKQFRISVETTPKTIKASSGTVITEGTLLSLDESDGKLEVWSDLEKRPYYIANSTFTMPAAGEMLQDVVKMGTVRADKLVYPSTLGINDIPAEGGANSTDTVLIPIEDLSAGADIAARNEFVSLLASEIVEIGILTKGTSSGVDDSNTAVIAIADGDANAIVSKTYDTANQPPDTTYASLGTLDATHKILTAGELVTIAVTQGTTANLPAFNLVIKYKNTISAQQTIALMLREVGIEAITTLENRY